MAISRVWVEEDCTACGLCEETCPEVFRLGDERAEIIDGIDLNEHEEKIKQAVEDCPVEVIKFE